MPIRILFVGTVEFSWHMLDEILRTEGGVVAVYSTAREAAEGTADWRDLSDLTEPRGIEHRKAADIASAENVARVRELAPDVILVMGFSQRIPPELLSVPRLGAIASHPSLLPKNRGFDAVTSQILNGESESGVTFFQPGQGLQDGPIVSQRRFPVTLGDTAGTLYAKAVTAGREMIAELMMMLKRGRIEATPQDASKATTLRPLRVEERRIDWKRNARKIYDLVRATTSPFAGAYCYLGARKVTVWEAGFSHEPTDGRPGEVVRISDRGVEVVTGAGLLVLRVVQTGPGKEHALDVFSRAGVELGAVLT